MQDETGMTAAEDSTGARDRGGWERALLLIVLMVVGGAIGYAAFLASSDEPVEDTSSGDVEMVSSGEKVDLEAHAVKGKYTIYDFYADWCAPCRALDPQLRRLAARHANLAIRKIDIIDWTTPVVAQHGVEGLPYMVLYGPDGKHLASGDEVYTKVSELFETDLY